MNPGTRHGARLDCLNRERQGWFNGVSELWNLIQEHLDQYGVREAEFARRMGSTPQTLNSWKNRGLKQLPERRLLEGVAAVLRCDYETVLRAALVDIGYAELPASEQSGPYTVRYRPVPGSSSSRSEDRMSPPEQGSEIVQEPTARRLRAAKRTDKRAGDDTPEG